MATTRLRKTFHYPSDSDSEPDELDEEHQEKLIASFQAEDAQKNELYRNAFLSIHVISTLFFLYTFVVASTARQRLIALLSISSMISAAYILEFMPIEAPKRKEKGLWSVIWFIWMLHWLDFSCSPRRSVGGRVSAMMLGERHYQPVSD
jgi:hypothetical protein